MNYGPGNLHSEDRRGMQVFKRWLRRETFGRMLSPSDIDSMIHIHEGDRLLFIEFKRDRIQHGWNGQLVALQLLSRREGVTVLVVDEGNTSLASNFGMDGRLGDDEPLGVAVVQPRELILQWHETTILGLNRMLHRWHAGSDIGVAIRDAA